MQSSLQYNISKRTKNIITYKYTLLNKFKTIFDIQVKNNKIIILFCDDNMKEELEHYIEKIIDGFIERKIIFSVNNNNITEYI